MSGGGALDKISGRKYVPSGVRWNTSSKHWSWKLVDFFFALPWWVKTILVLVLLGLIGHWTLDAYLAGRTLQELIQSYLSNTFGF